MKIQRVSNQSQVEAMSSLFEKHQSLKDRTPEMKSRAEKTKDRSWEKVAPAAKLSHGTDENGIILGKGSSIRSAQTGSISDVGGPNKHLKLQSSNSIFSPDRANEAAQQKTSKEATVFEKAAIAASRAEKETKWRESTQPKVGEAPDRMPRIGHADCQEGSKGWVPSHKMSMFDSKEFERLAEPAGEKIEKRVAKKDDSWRQPAKAMNTKDATAKMVDNLTADREGDVKNNRRESAVDRLFNLFTPKSE